MNKHQLILPDLQLQDRRLQENKKKETQYIHTVIISYLVNDDVPPPLTGCSDHLLETPGGFLDNLFPLALVVSLAGLSIDLPLEY